MRHGGSRPSWSSRDRRRLFVLLGVLVAGDAGLLVVDLPATANVAARAALACVAALAVGVGVVVGFRRDRRYGVVAVALVPVAVWYALSGFVLLRRDLGILVEAALRAVGVDTPLYVPGVLDLRAERWAVSGATARRAFRHHYAVVGLVALLLAVAAGRRVRRRSEESATD